MIKDSEGTVQSMRSLVYNFGVNPGNALYRYLGVVFYKYVGDADITFRQLYEVFGVELAICVTNVTRASVEFLHVKTSPNYPIRKAVRMSMSLPFIIQPCREHSVHGLVHDEVLQGEDMIERANLRKHMIHEMHQCRQDQGHPHHSSSIEVKAGKKKAVGAAGEMLESFVDGGLLNNYPIDAFDGWGLSMKPEDSFYRKLIGTGGHANYLNRFEGLNPSVLGFRLTSDAEPDGMHTRLGNSTLELKVRSMSAARLPQSERAELYRQKREAFERVAKERGIMNSDLRASMDWVKELHRLWNQSNDAAQDGLLDAIVSCDGDLRKIVEQLSPPAQLIRVFGLESKVGLANLLDNLYKKQIRGRSHLHEHNDGGSKHEDEKTKRLHDEFRMVIFEIEKMCESLGEALMATLVGCNPIETETIEKFLMRTLDAMQETADERVQTKENMRRTCMLDTEYVGTLDFKIEEPDLDFLWRKGYATTVHWLEKRIDKKKEYAEREKKQGQETERESARYTGAERYSDTDRYSDVERNSESTLPEQSSASMAWGAAAAWAIAARKKKEREEARKAAAENMSSEAEEWHRELTEKKVELQAALERCRELEEQLATPSKQLPISATPMSSASATPVSSAKPSVTDVYASQYRHLEQVEAESVRMDSPAEYSVGKQRAGKPEANPGQMPSAMNGAIAGAMPEATGSSRNPLPEPPAALQPGPPPQIEQAPEPPPRSSSKLANNFRSELSSEPLVRSEETTNVADESKSALQAPPPDEISSRTEADEDPDIAGWVGNLINSFSRERKRTENPTVPE